MQCRSRTPPRFPAPPHVSPGARLPTYPQPTDLSTLLLPSPPGGPSDFDGWSTGSSNTAWLRLYGSTGSTATGPTSSTSGSYYVYCETSTPNFPGATFDLTQTWSGETVETVTFYYSMYGATSKFVAPSQAGIACPRWPSVELHHTLFRSIRPNPCPTSQL